MKASLIINNNTREILKAIGKKGETYDQIIRELKEKKIS
jgi:transcription antitermination factor NusA-like protein